MRTFFLPVGYGLYLKIETNFDEVAALLDARITHLTDQRALYEALAAIMRKAVRKELFPRVAGPAGLLCRSAR